MRAGYTSLLGILSLGFALICAPITTSQAAEGGSVEITGLKISSLPSSADDPNIRHFVVLQGIFTNTSEQEISKLELNLVSTPAIKSRSQLAELISDPTITNNLISSDFSSTLSDVAPGAKRNWQIAFAGEEVFGGDAAGVYGLGVKPNLPGNNEATVITTPWFFNADIKPTNVAFAVPLTTLNDHLGSSEVQSLKTDLAEAQRLTNLIASQSNSKISWLQDAALRSWVSQLVASSDSQIPVELGVALDDLPPNASFLPFGSADLIALSLSKQKRELLDTIELTRAIASSQPIFYAPVQGMASSEIVSLLNGRGIRTIVSNEFLRGNAQLTTDAVATSDTNPVLVHDLATSSCLSGAGDSDAAFFRTVTCVKSEIGMMTAESPQRSRSIILLAPTNWRISTEQISALIAELSDHNWMQLKDLRLVATAEPAKNFDPLMDDYQNQLTRLTIRQADELRTQTETLSSVFIDAGLAAGFDSARILGFSELWGTSADATKYLSKNIALIKSYFAEVTIQASSQVTTPEEKSEIPITIVNDSDLDVSVSVELTSTATSRFSAEPTELIQVGSGQRITVPVAITLLGAGVVDVQAQLIAPNGESFGEVQNMQISSAAYSQFARTLVWGAFGLLVLLALSNFVKRQKDRRLGKKSAS